MQLHERNREDSAIMEVGKQQMRVKFIVHLAKCASLFFLIKNKILSTVSKKIVKLEQERRVFFLIKGKRKALLDNIAQRVDVVDGIVSLLPFKRE